MVPPRSRTGRARRARDSLAVTLVCDRAQIQAAPRQARRCAQAGRTAPEPTTPDDAACASGTCWPGTSPRPQRCARPAPARCALACAPAWLRLPDPHRL